MILYNYDSKIYLGKCIECNCSIYEVDGKLRVTTDLPDHQCRLEGEEQC